MRNAGNVEHGTMNYSAVAIGGGGWATGLDIADDGTIVIRNDVGYAYVRGPAATKWTQLIRPGDNIAANQIDIATGSPWNDAGTVDVAICATNSSVNYVWTMGYIYKTTDGGATYTRTAFPQNIAWTGNDQSGKCGRFIAVDPQNANVVYVGTSTGLAYSLDGGATWSTVSTGSIPAPTSGKRMMVAFDRSSAVTGGKTQGIYVFSNGSGLYVTPDAGASWAAVAGTPRTTASCIVVHPTTGAVFIAGDGTKGGNSSCSKYASASWTTAATVVGRYVVLKPSDATKVFLFNDGGSYYASTDSGATFNTSAKAPTRSYTDIPWHVWTKETYMSGGAAIYDPTQDRIWIVEGIGVWSVDTPSTTNGGTYPCVERSKGIESLVCGHAMVTPEGRGHFTFSDRSFFVRPQSAMATYPSQHGPDNVTSLHNGSMQDYAIDDHNFVVGSLCVIGTNGAYQSSDGGATWSTFATDPASVSGVGSGGNIAVSNKNNMVFVSASAVYTLDGGATWNSCNIASAGWFNATNHKRHIVVADKMNAGTFYLYNRGTGVGDAADLAMKGIWKTTNGGVSWSRVRTTVITTFGVDVYHGDFKQVPGQAGHFMWSAGDGGDGLYLSTDYCATWSKISGSGETYKYGFGAAIPGGSGYPTILCSGYRGSTYGFWLSHDAGASWTQICTFPGNFAFDWNTAIEGDMSKFGRFYAGWLGTGVGYFDYTDTAHAT